MNYRTVSMNILPLAFALFSATIMQLRWLDFGLNPNIFLALLSAYSFFADSRYFFIIMTLIGIVALKSKPVFEISSLSFVFVGIFIFFIRKTLPVFSWVGVFFVTLFSTFLFYSITNYEIFWDHFGIVFFESLYNGFLSIVFYLIFKLIYGEER